MKALKKLLAGVFLAAVTTLLVCGCDLFIQESNWKNKDKELTATLEKDCVRLTWTPGINSKKFCNFILIKNDFFLWVYLVIFGANWGGFRAFFRI